MGVPRRYDIRDYISKINRIRREHPALQAYRNLMFCRCDNQRIIFYARLRAEDQLLIAVSLDPFSPQQANLEIPHRELGTNPKVPLEALDLLTRTPALWQGPTASVQLTPEAPAAIWQIQRIDRTEASFEYYY